MTPLFRIVCELCGIDITLHDGLKMCDADYYFQEKQSEKIRHTLKLIELQNHMEKVKNIAFRNEMMLAEVTGLANQQNSNLVTMLLWATIMWALSRAIQWRHHGEIGWVRTPTNV